MGKTLKLPREKEGLWLTKDNKLVMMEANMTVTTYKLINYFLWKSQHEKQINGLSVDCRKVLEDCNIKTTSFSKLLKAECEKVVKTTIKVETNDEKWELRQVITNMTYDYGVLTADINPKIVPYIQGLEKKFTQSNLRIANKCESYAAYKLYEICCKWLGQNQQHAYAYFTVDQWRGFLGATQKYYEVFSKFKDKILKPAIEAVNKCTDVYINMDTIEYKKTGRKISHVKLNFERIRTIPSDLNKVDDKVIENIEKKDNIKNGSTIRQSLEERDVLKIMIEEFKIKKETAKELLKEHKVEKCLAQIKYARKMLAQGKIKKSKSGYLRRAIENDFASNEEALEKAKQAEEKESNEIKEWDKEIEKSKKESNKDRDTLTEEELIKNILEENISLANLFRSLKVDDGTIARWIEKYPHQALFDIGCKALGVDNVSPEYIETNIKFALH